MSAILLQACNITRTYHEGGVDTTVLKGINLEIFAGEMTAIIGKSGSGKSTLLQVLGTLDAPSSGQILFKGRDLNTLSAKEQAAFRCRSLGFIYQFHHLLYDFSALENVMIPLLIAGRSKTEAKQRAAQVLQRVGLEHRMQARPGEMSGGERQRAAIARALANAPELILADEPTGSLDAANAHSVYELFAQLVHEDHTAVIMVTHDQGLAARCDRVVEIKDGRI